jgi:hypothetical protein
MSHAELITLVKSLFSDHRMSAGFVPRHLRPENCNHVSRNHFNGGFK